MKDSFSLLLLRCVTFCFQHASFPNEGFWTFVSFHSTFHFIAYLYSTHFYPNFKYTIHDKSDYYNETFSLDIWNSKGGIAFTYFYKTKKQMHTSCRIHFIVNKRGCIYWVICFTLTWSRWKTVQQYIPISIDCFDCFFVYAKHFDHSWKISYW